MRMLSRFWSGLEALPGLAGVLLDWQEVWREQTGIGRSFLRPTGDLATTYPCPYPGGAGCPRGVVMHGEQDIVAVCRSVPRQCETIKLTKADIVVYELDWKALGVAIASALDLTTPSKSAQVALPSTARLGWHYLTGGKRTAVYLTIQHDPQAFNAILSRLLAEVNVPFILAAPTAELCESDSAELLRRTGILFLPLSDCLAWEDSAGFVPTVRAKALLSDLAVAAVASPARTSSRGSRPPVVPVDVPTGTRWDELLIVMDDHFIECEVRGRREKRHFSDAGFVDYRRKDYPNDDWRWLHALARGGGTLHDRVPSPTTRAERKHRMSSLGKRLHGLFQIAGDPIEKPRGQPYRTLFRIRLKDGITISVPADCTWSQIAIAETRMGNIRFAIDTKEQYVALSDGRLEEFSREMAERPDTVMIEHTLGELGFLHDDGQLNPAGRSLLDVLRAEGTLSRAADDEGLLRLGHRLCQMTGINDSAFHFNSGRSQWISFFAAGSEVRQR